MNETNEANSRLQFLNLIILFNIYLLRIFVKEMIEWFSLSIAFSNIFVAIPVRRSKQ